MLVIMVLKSSALRDEDNIPNQVFPSGGLGKLQKMPPQFLKLKLA